MRLLAVTSYKGTNYAGWQKQPNALTIEEEIEKALSQFFNKEINIYGAGRTDAGVHAYGQTFHFDVEVDELDIDRLIYSLNKMLPEDIKINDMEEVEDSFHARYSAKGKFYSYTLCTESKDPFWYDKAYMFPNKEFDVEVFKDALSRFEGKHNFKNFTSKEEDQDNFVREIFEIEVVTSNNNESPLMYVLLHGNGFMRYMIRYIIGYALDVACGRYTPESIDDLLDDNSERNIVSSKAPACGLALVAVDYDD